MLPRFRRGAFALFAVTFLVTMLLGDRRSIADALTLEPALVLAGTEWWTPLTTMFRYAEGLGLLGLLFTLKIQWVIGSRLEGFWGTARYLLMVLVASAIGYASVLGLAAALPSVGELSYAGAAPIDVAAAVAFGIVFRREQMLLGGREVSSVWIAGFAGAIALLFPTLVAIVAGIPAADAWPASVPALIAGLVAVVFVQPWRNQPKSGKVAPKKASAHPHLRVVRTPEDMLNRQSLGGLLSGRSPG